MIYYIIIYYVWKYIVYVKQNTNIMYANIFVVVYNYIGQFGI